MSEERYSSGVHQCTGVNGLDFHTGVGQIDRSYLGEIRLARRATRLLIEFEGGAVIEMTPEQEAEFWKQVREVTPYNIYAHKSTTPTTPTTAKA